MNESSLLGGAHFALTFLLSILLPGCGTDYAVSADSLRDDALAAAADTYFLEPADESVFTDDCCSGKSSE